MCVGILDKNRASCSAFYVSVCFYHCFLLQSWVIIHKKAGPEKNYVQNPVLAEKWLHCDNLWSWNKDTEPKSKMSTARSRGKGQCYQTLSAIGLKTLSQAHKPKESLYWEIPTKGSACSVTRAYSVFYLYFKLLDEKRRFGAFCTTAVNLWLHAYFSIVRNYINSLLLHLSQKDSCASFL